MSNRKVSKADAEKILIVLLVKSKKISDKKTLLKCLDNISDRNDALLLAAQFYNNNFTVAKKIIEYGYDFNTVIFSINETLKCNIVRLICFKGNIEILRLINPNENIFHNCLTPAAVCNNFDIIEYIFPFVNLREKEKALLGAVTSKNDHAALFFLEKEIYTDAAFFKAIKNNSLEIIKRMIIFGKYNNSMFGISALYHAAKSDSFEVFNFLIDYCDPNIRFKGGKNCLYQCISSNCQTKYIEILISISECDTSDLYGKNLIDYIVETDIVPSYFDHFLSRFEKDRLNKYYIKLIKEVKCIKALGGKFNDVFVKKIKKHLKL